MYGILCAQLLITTFLVFLACTPNLFPNIAKNHGFLHVYNAMLHNQTIFIIITVLYLITTCALMCCGMDKSVPNNYILLLVFTLCVSWMVSVACVKTEPILVLEAATLTFSVVAAITFYAFTTSTDFTVFGPILWILGFVFCTAGFLYRCFGYHTGLVYSIIGVILFSFYLLFDTQMIMGGDSKRY